MGFHTICCGNSVSHVQQCSFQVAVLKSDGKTLETGSWVTADAPGQDSSIQPQNIVTYHVSENGQTLVQEVLTEEEAAEGEQEFAQIAISAYGTARDFSVVEQTAEEIHSTATAYRYSSSSTPFFYLKINVGTDSEMHSEDDFEIKSVYLKEQYCNVQY